MPINGNLYPFDCYDMNMSPADRRAYLKDYIEKLDDVIYGSIEDMTTNEKRTLWRKIHGNSQSASPLVSHLGEVINMLFGEIHSVKNQKKSQLRNKTMEINSIKSHLNFTEGNLLDLSAAYEQLKNELENKNSLTRESQKHLMDKLAYEIEEAATREATLLESLDYLSQKIKQHGVIIPITEIPHHKAGIKNHNLLRNKTINLPNNE